MEYLLKVTAVVTIFYIIYKLFLQRDTFFESNRWFLIIGLISSLLIPFLVIPIYIEYTPLDFSNITVNEQVSTHPIEKPFNILDYLPLIYGLGVVFFSGRFIIQLISLTKIIYKNKGIKKDQFVFIETQDNTSPFSFFKWIVFNPESFNQTELEHIIKHEKTHAKQYHSVDILITKLFCVLLWFNPFMWFYNKDLKQNLEFIADKRTLNRYNYKKSYQYTLLKTTMPSHQMALSNHFYNSLIKKRIVMLHKSKSKKINQLKYALVIPVIAFFLMSFNTKEVLIQKIAVYSKEKTKAETYTIDKNTSDNELYNIKSKINENGGSFSYSKKRNSNGEITGLEFEIIYKGTGNYKSEVPFKEVYFGTFLNGGIFIAENEEGAKKILKNRMNQMIEKNNTKQNSQTQQSNLKVIDSEELIISGTVTDISDKPFEKVMVTNGNSGVITNAIGQYKLKANLGDQLIFSYEGMQTQKIEVNNNKTIDIKLTPETASITKPQSSWSTSVGINKDVIPTEDEPLFIVNGEEVSHNIIKALDQNSIESMTVLKDEDAVKKYGDKGKNGVVLITLKESFESKTNVNVIGYGNKPHTITIKGVSSDGTSPLIIVDGKEISNKKVEDIDPDNVESMNVLKGETATKKYGDKGKNGVIEITTKK